MSSIPENFIFRYSVPVHEAVWPESIKSEQLDASFSFPMYSHYAAETSFVKTSSPEQRYAILSNAPPQDSSFDFRMGWNAKGLIFTVLLYGKEEPLRCDPTRLETSDGIHMCIDTRDVRDVHRASRFCHRFLFLPCDSRQKTSSPSAYWFPIHRAKSLPNPVDVNRFRLSADIASDGYVLSIQIPADTLTGYEPGEHRRLGFHFGLTDTELGLFSLQHSNVFPVEEDPGLWSVIELC